MNIIQITKKVAKTSTKPSQKFFRGRKRQKKKKIDTKIERTKTETERILKEYKKNCCYTRNMALQKNHFFVMYSTKYEQRNFDVW